MPNTAIKVSHLTKVYKLYDKPIDRLKESLHPLKKKYHKDFYALNDVSFEIKKGETVGIIGKNGAGKSTLLKIITGVLTPSTGHVHVNGRIASLLELGAGFNPEYTGIENIYLQGTLMGYSKEEMESKVEPILDFADIGDFVHQPVKMYSSGMFARLAFAVAINVEPDILIVDEALSVGDVKFQQKCIRKMDEFGGKGITILFVSHDIGIINKFCSKAIWIDSGVIRNSGTTDNVTNEYFLFMSYDDTDKNEVVSSIDNNYNNKCIDDLVWTKIDSSSSFGNKEVLITDISMYSEKTKSFKNIFSPGEKIIVYIKYQVCNDIFNPIMGFIIRDRLAMDVTGANTILYNTTKISEFKKGDIKIIEFKFQIPYIIVGKYSLSPAIASGSESNHEQLCWINDAIFFDIVSNNEYRDIGWYIGLNEVEIGEYKNE